MPSLCTLRCWSKWIGFLSLFIMLHAWLTYEFCTDLQHSHYRSFCPERGRIHDKSMARMRAKNAIQYMDSFNQTSKAQQVRQTLRTRLHSRSSDVCVAVVTVMRKSLPVRMQYLFQVLHRLLPEVLADDRVSLVIANAEKDPSLHTALRRYAWFIPSYHIPPLSSTGSVFLKERYDYGHALQACSQYKPKYIVLIEDDTVPLPGFFDSLRYLIKGPLSTYSYSESSKYNHPWAYTKLYYPERWSGFQNKDMPNLIVVSLLLGTFLVVLAYVLRVKVPPHSAEYSHRGLWMFTVQMTLPAAFLVLSVVWMLNRHHLDNLRLYWRALYAVTSPADRCCTPAVLYQSWAADQLSQHLISSAGNQAFSPETDLAIADFAEALGWVTYAVLPNLAAHHGRVSTLPKPVMDDVS
ncbi:post-GPI attachment to proteins factor 4-like [Sycon ciliatum]|uniref:post-GPI attachment to proteins factor 4-like n=1 Tax=Sycon ciliatum TaxID=27933 RepID=UPI0031F703EC